MTPTVLRSGPYRFFFYSEEGAEPPHVHAARDTAQAKLWLEPVAVAFNRGFAAHELNRVEAIVIENREVLIEAWNDFFTN